MKAAAVAGRDTIRTEPASARIEQILVQRLMDLRSGWPEGGLGAKIRSNAIQLPRQTHLLLTQLIEMRVDARSYSHFALLFAATGHDEAQI